MIPNIDPVRHRRLTQRPQGLPPDNIIKKNTYYERGMPNRTPSMSTAPTATPRNQKAMNQPANESSFEWSSVLLVGGAIAAVAVLARGQSGAHNTQASVSQGGRSQPQNSQKGGTFDWKRQFGL